MNSPCAYEALISFYLDRELAGADLARFETHLAVCETCRGAVELERWFLDRLRASAPTYSISAEFRSRMEAIVQDPRVYRTPQRLRTRILRILRKPRLKRTGFFRPALPLLVSSALLALLAFGVWLARTKGLPTLTPRHSDLAWMAVAAHRRHAAGTLPLELRSASPDAVSHWFSDKVDFSVKLPAGGEWIPGNPVYRIEGARLASFANRHAAYISYQVDSRPVSLMVVPTSVAGRLSGRKVPMQKLVIYYDVIDRFHVVTWAVPRGVTYAMVSDSVEHPNQSCIVCHATAKDFDFMHRLLR